MPKFLGSFEPGSAEWLALREGDAVVTGTLVGQICGVNPWESAYTAWAKATGRIPNEVKQSRAMRLGQLLEEPIIRLWHEENPDYQIEHEVGTWSEDMSDWARANPDGLLYWPDGTKGILEIKTSAFPFDELPLHYRYQVLWYMWVMGLTKGKVVALFGGRELKEFDVAFDPYEFSAMMVAVKRWRECVLNDVRPEWDGSDSTYQTVRDLSPRDVSDEPVDLGDLGMHLQNAQSDADKAYAHLQMLKSATLDNMGSASRGVVNVGGEEYVVCSRSVNKNGVVSLTVKKGKNV
jgi:putative phage-type endonuclease